MRFRYGFVSNSSTTSFLLIGIRTTEKRMHEEILKKILGDSTLPPHPNIDEASDEDYHDFNVVNENFGNNLNRVREKIRNIGITNPDGLFGFVHWESEDYIFGFGEAFDNYGECDISMRQLATLKRRYDEA
mgnify:CR=1 FL=1